MAFFTPKRFEPAEPEADQLSAEARALEKKLQQLESFIEEAPERAQQDYEERFATLPPPDELEDRRRERAFHQKLSRRELRNERRYQAKSGFLIVLLFICAISLAAWAVKIGQGS